MKVKVFDDTREFFGDSVSGKKVMDHIMGLLGEKNMALGHLLVDGEAVNNGHVKYIDKHIDEIKEIEAVPTTWLAVALQNAEEIRNTLAAFPPIMDVMAEDFRQGVSARGWKEFENMIKTFLFIDDMMKNNFSLLMSAKKPEYNMAWDKARSEYQKLYEVLHKIEKHLKQDYPEKAGDLIQKKVKPCVEKTIGYLDDLKNVKEA